MRSNARTRASRGQRRLGGKSDSTFFVLLPLRSPFDSGSFASFLSVDVAVADDEEEEDALGDDAGRRAATVAANELVNFGCVGQSIKCNAASRLVGLTFN